MQHIKLLVLLSLLTGATLAAASTDWSDVVSTNANDAASSGRNDAVSTIENHPASTDKSIWSHKLLQDWDNGWDVNFEGEPIDPNTACGGEPCIRFPLTKPTRVARVAREISVCKSPI
ncbi:hypothetical protein BGX26_007958, partial [Mortierella sp. AD094]